ncbi:MAG: hypothetical protein H6R25_839 [Proteobacteria bacterium]|nr:hypothetical protein [Pseudomonadota bacterium]
MAFFTFNLIISDNAIGEPEMDFVNNYKYHSGTLHGDAYYDFIYPALIN